MMRHMKGHSGHLRYKCDQCDQGFTTTGNLRRHVMRNHTGVRPYMCEICNKGFAFISDLRTHEHCHLPDSEKPLKCKICDRGFSVQSKLNMHIKGHSGERPYECEYEDCYKAFATSSRRTRHHHTHTGAKNYKCPECSKGFSQPGNLKRHIRNHSGLTPYKCIFCDYRSAEKGNLKRHVKYKHPPDYTEANLAIMLEPVFDNDPSDKGSDSTRQQNSSDIVLNDEMETDGTSGTPPDGSVQNNASNLPTDEPMVDETESNVISKVLPPLEVSVDEQNNNIGDFVLGNSSPILSVGGCLSNDLPPLHVDVQDDDITDLTSGNKLPTVFANVDESEHLPSFDPDVQKIMPDLTASVDVSLRSTNADLSLVDVNIENDLGDSNDIPVLLESPDIISDLPILSGPHVSQNDTDMITLCRNTPPTLSDGANIQKHLPILTAYLAGNDSVFTSRNPPDISYDVQTCNSNDLPLLSVDSGESRSGMALRNTLPIVSENVSKSPPVLAAHVPFDNNNITLAVTSEGTRVSKKVPLTLNCDKGSSSDSALRETPPVTMVTPKSTGIANDHCIPSYFDKEVNLGNMSSVVKEGVRKSHRVTGKSQDCRTLDVDIQDKINAIILRNTAVLESVGISK
ncbi:uncharacterized protein [Amphiura filiformis]|uniref:uncharacterized protein n=1 Tax=Amphiura filiformis TaxID=82378 RepID=UPI003B21C962